MFLKFFSILSKIFLIYLNQNLILLQQIRITLYQLIDSIYQHSPFSSLSSLNCNRLDLAHYKKYRFKLDSPLVKG